MTRNSIHDLARELNESDEFVRTKIRFITIATVIGVVVALLMSYLELQHGAWFRALPAALFPLFAPPLVFHMYHGRRAYQQGLVGFAVLVAIQQILGAAVTLNDVEALIWFPIFPLTYVLLLGHERALRWNAVIMVFLCLGYALFPQINHGLNPLPLPLFGSALLAYAMSMLLSWQSHRELSYYHRRLYAQASYDALTGAMMREPGLEVLGRQMAQVDRRPESGLCVALLDLDDFKRINDEDGHLAGDRVLVEVAAALRGQIRQGDYLVRLGGEEFLLLFPGMGTDGAHGMSEQLRARIPEVTTGLSARPVTASIGLTRYRPGESVGQLLGRADELMYAAKTTGKNRICCEDAGGAEVGFALPGQTG
ncbi:hypothetical protein BJI67_03515 [Acidihalobacter aeolianus]|uniref:diguanylate cyclase n=1 Tax=Acidihalobacter aeolianus TaxID=2792603 RepID=A0A1D8K5M7_9GAMM|nr:GGDEF domain-containing protein [Acidihalobacter aeolianus]AOV16263.1 hypothetical protein BJI67_03515 [Acidihalobacter aeolianus]